MGEETVLTVNSNARKLKNIFDETIILGKDAIPVGTELIKEISDIGAAIIPSVQNVAIMAFNNIEKNIASGGVADIMNNPLIKFMGIFSNIPLVGNSSEDSYSKTRIAFNNYLYQQKLITDTVLTHINVGPKELKIIKEYQKVIEKYESIMIAVNENPHSKTEFDLFNDFSEFSFLTAENQVIHDVTVKLFTEVLQKYNHLKN